MPKTQQPADIPAFAATQLALLDAELQSEISETAELVAAHTPAALQRAGLALTNLVVSSRRTGLGGRTVLELAPDAATASSAAGGLLPEHGLRSGDIVLAAEQPAGSAKKREVKELERKGTRGGRGPRAQGRCQRRAGRRGRRQRRWRATGAYLACEAGGRGDLQEVSVGPTRAYGLQDANLGLTYLYLLG